MFQMFQNLEHLKQLELTCVKIETFETELKRMLTSQSSLQGGKRREEKKREERKRWRKEKGEEVRRNWWEI